uniref:DNA-directed RNA polymerase subunit beta'' n=1 Tax=Dipteris conjugata TaxID=32108 RepID=A0A0B5ED25_9MONI|nr:RNA polymerase beta'' subunit [Dipteris conjugata]AXX76510.1 RNA polymerase beta' subunit [Dipteris conjugata]
MVDQAESLYYNKMMDKTAMRQLISRLTLHFGITHTTNILDQIKSLGFEQATKASISSGIDDPYAVPIKGWLVEDAEKQGSASEQSHRCGGLHAVEKLRHLIETWYATSECPKREMNPNFRMTDPLNPVHMMSFSGARGSISQVHQLLGMRGLMSDPRGQVIDLPIRSNLREGLSLTEYIISRYGARKGVVDTAVRTSDAGYLTRRLVEVVQHIVVRERDRGTIRGIAVNLIGGEEGSTRTIPQQRLVGRVLAGNVYLDMRRIAMRNQDIDNEPASNSVVATEPIHVRSPPTRKSIFWICQLCYGWGLAHHDLVELGEAVGIIAGQPIGEPGTQLTSRTSHTGGVFTGDIAEHVRIPFNGIINSDEKSLYPTRTRHGQPAWMCQNELPISIRSQNDTHNPVIPAQSILVIQNNQYVESKRITAEVRAKEFPLKERIKRKIYPNLEGETYWNGVVYHSPEDIHSNIHVVRNSGHVRVLSGTSSDSNGNSFYEDQDRIDTRSHSNESKRELREVNWENISVINSGCYQEWIWESGINVDFESIKSELNSSRFVSTPSMGRGGGTEVVPLSPEQEGRYRKLSYANSEFRILNNVILDRNEIIAICEDSKYRTNVSGVVRYGTAEVEPIDEGELVSGSETASSRSRYKVTKGGNSSLIPEEVYTICEPSSSILVKNNSVVEEGTQITSNIISQMGGLVRIEKIPNSIKIRILPGYIYYPKKKTNISKQADTLIPPGHLILGEFKSDNWVYPQPVASARRRKPSVSIRTVVEYNVPGDSPIRMPEIPKTEKDLGIQVFTYIFYRDGEVVEISDNTDIQLVQTCLVADWQESPPPPEGSYLSLTNIKISDSLSTFLQVNPMGLSNPFLSPETRAGEAPPQLALGGKLSPINLNSRDENKNKEFVGYRGTIHVVPQQGASFLILSPSNLFRNPLPPDPDGGVYGRGGAYSDNSGSGGMTVFRNNIDSKDPHSDSDAGSIWRGTAGPKGVLTDFGGFYPTTGGRGNKKLGLLGDSQNSPYSLLFSYSVSSNKVSFAEDPFVDESTDASGRRYWYSIDENESIFEYSPDLLVGGCFPRLIFPPSYFPGARILPINLGLLVSENACIYGGDICLQSGQIIAIHREYSPIRTAKPLLATEGATIHKNYGDIIGKGDTLITLLHDRSRSGDIIQGFPKVEQLLESRSTAFTLARIEDISDRWRRTITRLVGNPWSHFTSAGIGMEDCQLVPIDQIQKVHGSQGVQISDRHIEIIIRQLTSKVVTLEDGITNVFLPGELIESSQAQRMNRVLKESNFYEPVVLGMTKASLNTTSFISEASFQETTRVLARAAIRGRIDWLKGLKENVILGDLVPIGTGSQEVIRQLDVERNTEFYLAISDFNIFSREARDIPPHTYYGREPSSHHRLMIHEGLRQPLPGVNIGE